MAKTDKRIDAYIENAQLFAQPILKHLRELIHEGCPGVEETVKWGMPSFEYKGPFFSMAAFKQHAVFGFWKAKLINDPKGYLDERKNHGGEAMGHGGRIESMKDLPPDKVFLDFVRQAKKLNDEGVKVPKENTKPKGDLVVPDYFMAAIAKNKDALRTFEAFSTSNKREYVDWVTEAKSEATREKRMDTAIEWMAEGKIRNWKYVRK